MEQEYEKFSRVNQRDMYKNKLLILIIQFSGICCLKMQSEGRPRIVMNFSKPTKFPSNYQLGLKKEVYNKKEIHLTFQKYQMRIKQLKILKESLNQLIRVNRSGIARQLPLINRSTRQFTTQRNQFRFYQKYIVAQSFCKHGYGPQAVLRFLKYYKGIEINLVKYNIIIRSIVSEAVSTLQKFIKDECKIQVSKIDIDELSTVYDKLLRCWTELRHEDCETLLGILKVIYGISSMTICEASGLKVYIEIRQQILKVNPKPPLPTRFFVDKNKPRKETTFNLFLQSVSGKEKEQIQQTQNQKSVSSQVLQQNGSLNTKQKDELEQKSKSEDGKQYMFDQQDQNKSFQDLINEDLQISESDNIVQVLTQSAIDMDDVICIDN